MIKPKKGKVMWGFDLTDFDSARTFEALLRRHNLLSGYRRINRSGGPNAKRGYYVYEWANKDVAIHTGNNPITGKFLDPTRDMEKGYASYIGIKGKPEAVRKLVADIKKTAEWIKDESPNDLEFIW